MPVRETPTRIGHISIEKSGEVTLRSGSMVHVDGNGKETSLSVDKPQSIEAGDSLYWTQPAKYELN
jgi:hypothetical protein